MDNRYICQFINSKDIRTHLEEINYEFSVPEYAYLIWQSKLISIEQRHLEWQKLIKTTDNCTISTHGGFHEWNLHETINEYISFEKQIIERLKLSDEKAYYDVNWLEESHAPWDDGWHGGNCFFDTFEQALSVAQEYAAESTVRGFKIKKVYIDNSTTHSGMIEAQFSPNGTMMDIDYWGNTDSMWTGYDSDVWVESFSEMWFDIPIPFKPGDLVCDYRDQKPFVLTDTVPWWKKEHPPKRNHADHSDMNASGYDYDRNTMSIRWNWCNYLYLNLEYYSDELEEGERILAAYSQFKHGQINGDTLSKLCQIITNETIAATQYKALDYVFQPGDKEAYKLARYERKRDYDK